MAPQGGLDLTPIDGALQMLKYSIKKRRPLNFTQGMSWTEELKEFEFAAQVEPVVMLRHMDGVWSSQKKT